MIPYLDGSLLSGLTTAGVSTSSIALSNVNCTQSLLPLCVFGETNSSVCLTHGNDMRLMCTSRTGIHNIMCNS